MRYIDKLNYSIPVVKNWIDDSLEFNSFRLWNSLIINRRKPHTYRVFAMLGDCRICLHRFEPCSEAEAFIHPHPWPAAFKILGGSYRQWVGRSNSLQDAPDEVMDSVLHKDSMYEITDPLIWHSVEPLETSYTIMLNGPVWEVQHKETRTTKGKDLESMNEEDLRDHLKVFQALLKDV
jgi:hypothetical protein